MKALPWQDGGGKQKGKISSKSEREGKEKKDGGGIKRVLWGPTKTGFIAARVKWAFYSWFPPYTLRGAPSGPFKGEEVCIRAWSYSLGQSPASIYPHFVSAMTNSPHKGFGSLCVLSFFFFLALSYLSSQKSSRAATYSLRSPRASCVAGMGTQRAADVGSAAACQRRGHSSVALIGREQTVPQQSQQRVHIQQDAQQCRKLQKPTTCGTNPAERCRATEEWSGFFITGLNDTFMDNVKGVALLMNPQCIITPQWWFSELFVAFKEILAHFFG